MSPKDKSARSTRQESRVRQGKHLGRAKSPAPRAGSSTGLIVSISGLRGVVGDTLTPDTVIKYANAFAKFANNKKIVIGRDGRYHGAMFADILSGVLAANGCKVVDIGICPTPTVQLAAEHSDAGGGVAVTASHNPMEWNGLKFINEDGVFLDADENKKLWGYVEHEPKYASFQSAGTIEHDDFFLHDHLRRVLAIRSVDVEAIRKRHFRVVVDCVNAAGSVVVPQLLNDLGCIVIKMNCDATGKFPRKPEPIPENLISTMEKVKIEKADLGIVVDPDVDRLVLITEKGEPFSEEYTIAQAVKFIFEKSPVERRIAAVNLSTTRAVDEIARGLNGKVFRSAVGEINVVKKMKKMDAVVGGEGSGGVILPEVHYGRDALVGIGITLQHLLEFGGTLSALKNALPKFEIVKKRIELRGKNPEKIIDAIRKHYSKFDINTEDGLKIDAPDYWIHLRKSNTEPIIRVITEARTKEEAESHAAEVGKLVEKS
ncbi:MAG: phosphoglucosamine mutase [Candidatus Kryptoniota bacterium]